MRNKLNLLTVSVLMVSSVFAQEGFGTLEGVMNELMNYKEEGASGSETNALVETEEKPDVTAEVNETLAVVESSEPVTAPSIPVEKDPESREKPPKEVQTKSEWGGGTQKLLSGGDFTEALQGLADLIKIAPEDATARLYLRTLMERDQRTAEDDGMDAVDAAWSTDLVLRSYNLVSGARERMQLGDATHSVDIGALFPQVDFPKGSSAIYQPETETIYVSNTSENLAVLETMMETMGVLKGFGYSDQVEIEAKFIEVSEGTLEELGFQWNFEDVNSVPPGNTTATIGGSELNVNDGAAGLFAEALRGSPNNIAGGALPFNQKVGLGDGTLDATGDWSSFRFVDTFNTTPSELSLQYGGGDSFEVLISALDQSSGADVLSAPRVLTRSGEEATIQVGELHYFPEVYEGDSAQATIVNVSYEDFEEKLLGVELTVKPKVNEDRDVMLELNPRITEIAGWQSYQLLPGSTVIGYTVGFNPQPIYETSSYNHRQLETSKAYYDHDPIVASLPIFKRREIKTQVTIADGSTIGMGGLINEKIERFEDNVPILGSLPLVGRLFRNEGERVVKRNLLMFVTAKIIDPNGRVDASRSFE